VFASALVKLPELLKRFEYFVFVMTPVSLLSKTARGAAFLVTYMVTSCSFVHSTRRFTATTDFPVPGPPSTMSTRFSSGGVVRARWRARSSTTFWSSIIVNSGLPSMRAARLSASAFDGRIRPWSIRKMTWLRSPRRTHRLMKARSCSTSPLMNRGARSIHGS
jgi:hypothetical protein